MSLMKVFGKLNCGELSFSSRLSLTDRAVNFDYSIYGDKNGDNFSLKAESDGFKDDLSVTAVQNGYIVRRILKNDGNDVRLKEIKTNISGFTFDGKLKDDYFYSVENPRIYGAFTFPIDYIRTTKDAKNSEFDVEANNRWADPGVVNERINYSPYQPFPAILLSNYRSKIGIVHGTLSQKVFFHNYKVCHRYGGIDLTVYSSFKDIAYRNFKSGTMLIDEWFLGRTDAADKIDEVFDSYTKVLRKYLPANYGASDINRNSMVWGSWNDGIFRDVNHEIIIDEAKALVKNFPTVRWLQLDDGYAVYNKEKNSSVAHGLGVPYEKDGLDYDKFPKGLKALTDEIKSLGLRPAVWIGGWCPKDSKIYTEHPGWFVDYSVRLPRSAALDVSIPCVRDYMLYAVDTLITEYGFDGVKHDFWSYAFEASDDLLSFKDRSGYEYRHWWCDEIRKRLPADGYFQTGCDVVLANPFLGEYFTNYRYGIDVGSGEWDNVKTCMLWGTACFATHTGDLFVPNSDAVGLLPGLNFTDFLFWLNYVLITHSAVELSGRFSKEFDKQRFNILKKALCNVNNGQDCYTVGFDYRKKGETIPSALYINTPFFSTDTDSVVLPVKTVAVFNTEEKEKTVSVPFADLGLTDAEYICTDVWNGGSDVVHGKYEVELSPHESRLIAINAVKKYAVLDADVKIGDAKLCGKSLTMYVDGKDAEIKTKGKVVAVRIDGEDMDFTADEGVVRFSLPCAGRVTFDFE